MPTLKSPLKSGFYGIYLCVGFVNASYTRSESDLLNLKRMSEEETKTFSYFISH